MAITFRDFLTFPFNSGRGIRMRQIDGVQIHSTALTVDSLADPTRVIADPSTLGGVVPASMLLYGRLPAAGALPRTARDLELQIGGGAGLATRPLLDPIGSAVKPRDLNPNCLHGLFVSATTARFVDPLPPRMQDFDIVVSWTSGNDPLSSADLAATSETFATSAITVPEYPGGGTPPSGSKLWFGVPADARRISRIESSPGGGGILGLLFQESVTLQVGGVDYHWWRLGRQVAGATRYVVLGDY